MNSAPWAAKRLRKSRYSAAFSWVERAMRKVFFSNSTMRDFHHGVQRFVGGQRRLALVPVLHGLQKIGDVLVEHGARYFFLVLEVVVEQRARRTTWLMSWMEVRARPFSSYSSRAATTISADRLAVSLLRSTSRVATPRVLFVRLHESPSF